MNRKIVVLSVALLVLAGTFGWLLRQRWLDQRAKERAVLEQAAHPRPLPAPPPVPAVSPASPADYLGVAQNTLFSQDRNPNVLVDPPKPAPPPPAPPPMPALPVYYGQMNFGTPVVVLTVSKAPKQKSYAAGDKVGEFVVTSFDRDSITLDWDGQPVHRKLTDLMPKEGQAQVAQSSAPQPAPLKINPELNNLAPPPPKDPNQPPEVGPDAGNGRHACVTGDTAPTGTERGGFRKVVTTGLFGQMCYWEQSK